LQYTVKKSWRIINGKIVVDTIINPFFVYEALQKRKKGFIIYVANSQNFIVFQCRQMIYVVLFHTENKENNCFFLC
jgi:hypothetical protein